jgi:hypothetical protein
VLVGVRHLANGKYQAKSATSMSLHTCPQCNKSDGLVWSHPGSPGRTPTTTIPRGLLGRVKAKEPPALGSRCRFKSRCS